MSQRDFQRSKVYNLDSALPASARRASFSLEECTELIHKAHRYYGLRWTGRVKDGRGTTMARGSAIWISLPKWSRSTCVVLHESAHAIHHQLFRATWQSETVPHGAEFTRIMIELWAMDDPIMLEHLIHAAGMRGIYVSANPRVVILGGPADNKNIKTRGSEMASKITTEFIRSKAIIIETEKCFHAHEGCSVERITCAVQTPGGASHAMHYNLHSTTGELYGGARPYCGSRRILGQHTGAFVAEVTCKKC